MIAVEAIRVESTGPPLGYEVLNLAVLPSPAISISTPVINPALILSALMYHAYTYVETTLSARTVPVSRTPPFRAVPEPPFATFIA